MEPNEEHKPQVFNQDNLQNVVAGCSGSSNTSDLCDKISLNHDNKITPENIGPPRQIKWKNAFGFVYQVRRKLGSQPKLYNEFIDIMRRVHSRTIQTPDVVSVISELFKNHPDLIQGFNVFLPEKYRVDVKVPMRVSSTPSPDSPSDSSEKEELSITTRIIRFTLNVRKRFEDEEKRPDKYKRFLEVLYLYKALSQQLQGIRKCRNIIKEEDVYAEVRKLFDNNDDLLLEFSEYLPYNRKLSEIYKDSYKYYNDNSPYNCSCCSNVSSSSQLEINNITEQILPNDEVTSSDDSRLSNFSQNSLQKDISSTHIKSEITDKYLDESNFIVSDDREIDNILSAVPEKVFSADEDCFIRHSDIYHDQNEDMLNKNIDFSHKIDQFDIDQKENFIKTDEKYNERYITNENEFNFKFDERSLRKPLTPFKMPNPPCNIMQETIKNINEDDFILPKRSGRLATARPASPPTHSMESSVITRLAKRAALGSPLDTDYVGDISPERQPLNENENLISPPKSSDRRLKNLRKRLRRLANL